MPPKVTLQRLLANEYVAGCLIKQLNEYDMQFFCLVNKRCRRLVQEHVNSHFSDEEMLKAYHSHDLLIRARLHQNTILHYVQKNKFFELKWYMESQVFKQLSSEQTLHTNFLGSELMRSLLTHNNLPLFRLLMKPIMSPCTYGIFQSCLGVPFLNKDDDMAIFKYICQHLGSQIKRDLSSVYCFSGLNEHSFYRPGLLVFGPLGKQVIFHCCSTGRLKFLKYLVFRQGFNRRYHLRFMLIIAQAWDQPKIVDWLKQHFGTHTQTIWDKA